LKNGQSDIPEKEGAMERSRFQRFLEFIQKKGTAKLTSTDISEWIESERRLDEKRKTPIPEER
jgi:hypothetical protein